MADGNLTVNIEFKQRWWFPVAFRIGFLLLYFDLVEDAHSDEHFGGRITATERVTSWLVKYGIIVEAKPNG